MVRIRFALAACLSIAMLAIRDGPARAFDHVTFAIERCAGAISRFFVSAWALFAPEEDFGTDNSWLASVPGGAAIDPALLNSKRHEAGMPRRAAPRNT